MKMKIGKNFREIYKSQKENQERMLSHKMYDELGCDSSLPIDNENLSSYHILQLMSEIGEVLDADKRWKNFRNKKYDKVNKAEEIADCFIVLLNIAMFSGIDEEMLENEIVKKIEKVKNRIDEHLTDEEEKRGKENESGCD